MRKLLLNILLLVFFIFINAMSVSAQHTISEDLIEKMQKVHHYAQEGYDKRSAVPLLKAAEILLYNPQIRPFEENEISDSTSTEHYFNPIQLIEDAKEYRPVDARILKWRIRLLEKRIPKWEKWRMMNPAGTDKLDSDIQVKNFLIYSKNSKTIDTDFRENKTITLSVRVGNDLRLSVWDKNKKAKVGKSEAIGDARLISFTTESKGVYQIKIENVSSKANNCILMIETR